MIDPGKILQRLNRAINRLRMKRLMRRQRGVIHVGANFGQGRARYAALGLEVLWIEPIPSVFATLKKNIEGYPRQRAVQYLVVDRDGETRTFKIASNAGASSSIFDFSMHRDIWPAVDFVDQIELPTTTLDTIVSREAIELGRFDTLVLDTQGAELLVLKGAEATLPKLTVVTAEVADFEAYAGCPRPEDIEAFLSRFGFREMMRTAFANHPSGGRYYDIVYQRH